MKKLINISVLVFLMTIGFNAKAAEGLDVSIKGKEIVVVEAGKLSKGTHLFLQDTHGEILFKDSLMDDEPYKTSLNLAVIPEGIYYLNLEKEFAIHTTVIVKSGNGLEIVKGSSQIAFKPRFKVEEDKVKVFLSNPASSSTSLRIYDAKGEVVGSCGDDGEFFRKTLDFSKMPAGEYTINIQNGRRNFTRKISIS